ncbi:uncharacterized protein LOC119782120 [Cyprinodon tularosa]|uniref:uncharacterized protein LOC119782120 n=1 Tax=Cyprinodon tularosa TaxID=77115 RepID=UPI0018E25CAE|nr:uncharacterized protein LOC119782120 [Cyprinodon tularosa]XP_038138852.1 uncharacterized protein LOC119782120 [Cyprinodon tularosa]
MERLKSYQDQLTGWLSADTEHILNKSGDILSVNEYKDIIKKPSEEQMICLLRTIIEKGEETCEKFTEILKKNQDHYHQLKEFFSCSLKDSAVPTMFADGNSVITQRKLSNIKAKSLKLNVETVSSATGKSSGNTIPGANYTATDGSVIFADQLEGVSVDTIDFSVNIKQSRDPAALQGATNLSNQDPSAKMIIKHKVELIRCLMADPKHILQHVHQESIITDREYQNLKSYSKPEEAVTMLIDQVIEKLPETCCQFLKLLQDPKVLKEYPKLAEIFMLNPNGDQ